MKLLLPILSSFIAVVFVGCSSNQISQEPPPQADKLVQREYDQARMELSKNPIHALKRLENIIQKHPNTSAASDSAKLAGDFYFKNKKYPQALNAYNYLITNDYREPYEGEIFTRVVKLYFETNNREKALAIVNQGLRYNSLTPDEKVELLNYRLEFLKEAQDVMGQLETLADMYNLSSSPQAKAGFRIRASTIVDSLVRPRDLDAVLSNSKLTFVHANIHYRLGSVAFEQSNFSEARSHFAQVVSINPDSELAESARDFLRQLDARSSVSPRTVGVILPLSGKIPISVKAF
jgi:tetratricopeptide (TPR) repeat protein